MERLTLDAMGDVLEPIQMTYLDAVAAAPRAGDPGVVGTTYNGIRTTNVLVELWEAHHITVLAAYAAGGWTENEYEKELSRRLGYAV